MATAGANARPVRFLMKNTKRNSKKTTLISGLEGNQNDGNYQNSRDRYFIYNYNYKPMN